jgi:transposase
MAMRTVVEIVRTLPDQMDFALPSRRGVVERFFAWLNRSPRLARDFEGTIAGTTSFLYVASEMLLARRLARSV